MPELEPTEVSERPLERELLTGLRRRLPAVIASVVFGFGLLWLLHAGALPVLPDRAAQAGMAWWTVPAYAGLVLLTLSVRAARWHWLLAPLHPMPLRQILAVNFTFFAALLVLPLRMGEAVRPALLRREGRLSAWEAFGCSGAERVIDGLSSSVFLLGALVLSPPREPLPDRIGELEVPVALIPQAAYTALSIFGLAFLGIFAFHFFRNVARALTERLIGLVSKRLGVWMADKVDRVAEGLRFLPRFRYAAPFLLATGAFWALNVASLWVLATGIGVHLSFPQAAAVLGVHSLALLVPSAPGFFGTYQLSVYAGLAMYLGASEVTGAGSVVVFWMYTITVLIVLLTGALSVGPSLRARS